MVWQNNLLSGWLHVCVKTDNFFGHVVLRKFWIFRYCTMWDFSSNFLVSKILSNEGKLSFEKRGVINLKIWDKMQLSFSIYEFYSKVGVKLEILTPNMMILNFAFLSYDCLNIWKNWFIKTLITCFFLKILQRPPEMYR